MMSKQRIYTAAGILLSFVIAVGGWALTNKLIDIKSDKLLSTSGVTSASGVTWINAPIERSAATPNQNATDDSQSENLSEMTERDMVSILRSWESSGRQENPHEPTLEQISMEAAIRIGETALESLSSFIPADQLVFDKTKTKAYLSQRIPSDQNEQFLAPNYSYWEVKFEGEGIWETRRSANMRINAVTGKIWSIYIPIGPYVTIELDANDVENILTHYMEYLGINNSNKINTVHNTSSSTPSITATKAFADSDAYAVVNIMFRAIPDEKSTVNLIGVQIYVTAQTQ